MKKNNLLKLAKLIKCVQEVTTDNGTLISEGEIIVGSEVFVTDESGDLVPAADGEYQTENQIIKVESGVVVEIREKDAEPIEETETEETTETTEETETVEEKAETEEETEVVNEEETEETTEETVEDEKDKEIEQLKQRIAELEAENAELKEKLAEPVADSIEDQTVAMTRQDKVNKAIQNLAKAYKN